MSSFASSFSLEEARKIGEAIGIDWAQSLFDAEQFRMGLDVELEHGRREPETDVTHDDPIVTGKIALAHLNEFPDYYIRLAKMEAGASPPVPSARDVLRASSFRRDQTAMDNESASKRDPAERSAYMRLFYRDWHPTRLGRVVNRVWSWWAGLGLPPRILVTLEAPGRNSGRTRANVLVVATHDGHQYLVSMLGDGSEWVKNVRACGGRTVIKRGKSRPIFLAEVPPAERAPILKAYARVATSGRHHFPVRPDATLSEFAAIAARYPVFRIDPPKDP
jgi:deazaflavin-dependent oxidoreductase (nitroreductase family)